jgi:hypothetical protein
MGPVLPNPDARQIQYISRRVFSFLSCHNTIIASSELNIRVKAEELCFEKTLVRGHLRGMFLMTCLPFIPIPSKDEKRTGLLRHANIEIYCMERDERWRSYPTRTFSLACQNAISRSLSSGTVSGVNRFSPPTLVEQREPLKIFELVNNLLLRSSTSFRCRNRFFWSMSFSFCHIEYKRRTLNQLHSNHTEYTSCLFMPTYSDWEDKAASCYDTSARHLKYRSRGSSK